MQKILKGIKRDIQNRPGKTLLTLVTVGVGVAVLILAMSISGFLDHLVEDRMGSEGIVLTVTNGEFTEEGGLEQVRPPQLDGNQLSLLEVEMDTQVTPVVTMMIFDNIQVDHKNYQIRQVIGSDHNYDEVMNLEMIAGTFFTEEQFNKGVKTAAITRSLAEQLFGSVEEALGQTFTPPRQEFRGRREDTRAVVSIFKIGGVYEDPDELLRRSYGIADLVIPYTSMLPQGGNVSRMMGFMSSTFALRVSDMSASQAESQIRDILTREYGDDLSLYIWEGKPKGDSALLEEARNTVSTFTVVVNLLGFFLLVTGSIGILSIMMVEALGRVREISLERALGASKGDVLTEYYLKSLTMSAMAALTGLILAALFIGPFSYLLEPVLTSLGLSLTTTPSLTLGAIAAGLFSSLIIGGFFGALPVLGVMNRPLAETIREA